MDEREIRARARRWVKANRDEVVRRYATTSLAELAKELHVSTPFLRSRLIEWRVALRKQGDANRLRRKGRRDAGEPC
ncbi:hypothetical protein [Streptomyces avicenniae]|uniref:hypothetical protein n=1 Tax=Streptomyces avicenniae TaxID=500153 RepID=UPI00167CB7C5|nr:hypothetical protein [Streptomyces avicenniae]